MLYPELWGTGCKSVEVTRATLRWLDDDKEYANVCRDLLALREKVAAPGACGRAAEQIVNVVEGKKRKAAA